MFDLGLCLLGKWESFPGTGMGLWCFRWPCAWGDSLGSLKHIFRNCAGRLEFDDRLERGH